jgi:CheY-like chemotaxis protein
MQKPKVLTPAEVGLENSISSADKSKSRIANILLVDDSAENRNLIKIFLKNTNYKITEAENGEIAVDKAKTKDFDIILMDMQMPILDGYSAIKQIRAWEKLNHMAKTPIVALTAYALIEEQQKSLSAGSDRHMIKPIKKAELFRIVEDFLTNKKSLS